LGGAWTGFMWLRTETLTSSCEYGSERYQSIKFEELLVSHEGTAACSSLLGNNTFITPENHNSS
jgi:hypothetical protein